MKNFNELPENIQTRIKSYLSAYSTVDALKSLKTPDLMPLSSKRANITKFKSVRLRVSQTLRIT
jgi:hypothetical protein